MVNLLWHVSNPAFTNYPLAHRQCAREKGALTPDDSKHDPDKHLSYTNPALEAQESWRCPGCVENGLEEDPAKVEDSSAARRRASAPKLARDLLPSHRGASKPDSHSVFNQLIVNDDPMDGSRLLRKRKASTEEVEQQALPAAKKQRGRVGGRRSDSILSSTELEGRPAESTGAGYEAIGAESLDELGLNGLPARKARPQRPRREEKKWVSIDKSRPGSLVVSFQLKHKALAKLLASDPIKKSRSESRRQGTERRATLTFPTPYSANYATPFYSFNERENDELKSKPYGGILEEADADTSKTLPQASDRSRFEDARQRAEAEWRIKTSKAEAQATPNKIAGPASKIQCIQFGGFEIDTWYAAPYPEEYSRNRVLYICEFCLKYMNSEYVAWRHKVSVGVDYSILLRANDYLQLKCPAKHPPGDEIYRSASVSVFEVDGRKNPVYCQNLCLLAKLFLGSKTLYYDVEPFLFYVMTEYDELGCHFVGYFSKEKRPTSQNNVSCILTLPIHQRKGYGNLLIDFSYLLTRVEQKTGSPEKPLSDMGLVSYRNYWRLILSYQLLSQPKHSALSISDISTRTGMTADDIVSALEGLNALVRDPVTGTYALRLDYEYFKWYVEKWEDKNYVRLEPDALVWTPYIMGRSNLALWNQAPALTTVAPREEDDEEEEDESQQAADLQLKSDTAQRVLTNGTSGEVNPESASSGKPDFKQPNGVNETADDNVIPPAGPPPTSLMASDPGPQTQAMSSDSALNGAPSTPQPTTPSAITIPPTRFELFPPPPGTVSSASRKRAGRPNTGGRRRTTGYSFGRRPGKERDRKAEKERREERLRIAALLQAEKEAERSKIKAEEGGDKSRHAEGSKAARQTNGTRGEEDSADENEDSESDSEDADVEADADEEAEVEEEAYVDDDMDVDAEGEDE